MSSPPPGRPEKIASYAEFWPYYLREHARPLTRGIHIFGTGLALAVLAAAIAAGNAWLIPAALVCGYGPAWYAHFFVEKNRPGTFGYPLWSLLSDFRMAGLWAAGSLEPELRRAGVNASPMRD